MHAVGTERLHQMHMVVDNECGSELATQIGDVPAFCQKSLFRSVFVAQLHPTASSLEGEAGAFHHTAAGTWMSDKLQAESIHAERAAPCFRQHGGSSEAGGFQLGKRVESDTAERYDGLVDFALEFFIYLAGAVAWLGKRRKYGGEEYIVASACRLNYGIQRIVGRDGYESFPCAIVAERVA